MDLKDRERLEKLLNMLGSSNEGEIGNAGRLIKKMADKYNVTPADLCLKNPAAPRDHPARDSSFADDTRFYGRGWGDPRRSGFTGRAWSSFDPDEEARRRNQKEFQEDFAEGERAKTQDDFHRDREESIRRAYEERMRQERAKAERRPKTFTGSYFGLLGRLFIVYQAVFDKLDDFERDFIEDVLARCRSDRMLKIREVHMAKALLKRREEPEPLV